MTVFSSDPIGVPGLLMLLMGAIVFFVLLIVANRRRTSDPDARHERRDRRSWLGVGLQAVAIGIACFGPPNLALAAGSALSILEACAIAILMASAITLFFMASAAMGRNWAIVARTRSDHTLVEDGPFAVVRHPIYVALFAYMVALSVALGHVTQLLLAVPIYAVATGQRIRSEERLLRQTFGAAYDNYAHRVARFLPGVF